MNCTTYYHEGSQITQQKVVRSKSIDIQPIQKTAEVQADLILDEVSVTTFCGKLYNEKLEPVCGEVIKIIKGCHGQEDTYFQVVACTKTDEAGKYEVEVYGQEEQCYVIIEGAKLLWRPVTYKKEEPTYSVEAVKWEMPIINNHYPTTPTAKKGTRISDYTRF